MKIALVYWLGLSTFHIFLGSFYALVNNTFCEIIPFWKADNHAVTRTYGSGIFPFHRNRPQEKANLLKGIKTTEFFLHEFATFTSTGTGKSTIYRYLTDILRKVRTKLENEDMVLKNWLLSDLDFHSGYSATRNRMAGIYSGM